MLTKTSMIFVLTFIILKSKILQNDIDKEDNIDQNINDICLNENDIYKEDSVLKWVFNCLPTLKDFVQYLQGEAFRPNVSLNRSLNIQHLSKTLYKNCMGKVFHPNVFLNVSLNFHPL